MGVKLQTGAAGEFLMVGERGLHDEAEGRGGLLDPARPCRHEETREPRRQRRQIAGTNRQRPKRIEHPARHLEQRRRTRKRRNLRQADDPGVAGRRRAALEIALEDGDIETIGEQPCRRGRADEAATDDGDCGHFPAGTRSETSAPTPEARKVWI